MLNLSLLLPFICECGCYGTTGGHGCNPSPLSVKCAEQTDPGIKQRLDTLAVYLRAEPFLRSLWPDRCERVTGPYVSKRGKLNPLEVTTLERTLKSRFALSSIIFAKRLTKFPKRVSWNLHHDLFRTENWQSKREKGVLNVRVNVSVNGILYEYQYFVVQKEIPLASASFCLFIFHTRGLFRPL